MKLFHICTIANDLDQYATMRQSFLTAGFDEHHCRYSLFDNSQANVFDPYHTFNQIQETTPEPYIIFCHQDILLNQGDDFAQLVKRLEELESIDPRWAIAGNAGVNSQYDLVAKITDPNNTATWQGKLPQRVHSLDENFLVTKTSANLSTSKTLSGFHFYATDLCLNAILQNRSCYVMDFHLTHLSGGNLNESFWASQQLFYDRWHNQFRFAYVKTVTGVMMCSSKFQALQRWGANSAVSKWLFSKKYLLEFFNPK
jgi:hypothetical protein